jgi:hypothetical protein
VGPPDDSDASSSTTTLVRWSNQTLAGQRCDEPALNATRDQMVHERSGRVRHEFARLMGARFHVRKVSKVFSLYLLIYFNNIHGEKEKKVKRRNA